MPHCFSFDGAKLHLFFEITHIKSSMDVTFHIEIYIKLSTSCNKTPKNFVICNISDTNDKKRKLAKLRYPFVAADPSRSSFCLER